MYTERGDSLLRPRTLVRDVYTTERDVHTFYDEHVNDVNDARMMKGFEDLDLAKRSHWHTLLLIVHENTLEGNNASFHVVPGFVHFTIVIQSSLADKTNHKA